MTKEMIDEPVVTGRLIWQVATRWRAAVDRALAPLGLTHAQYALLGSLSGLSRSGVRPSQRELADYAGIEAIYVSKLIRTLERSGLVTRSEHPVDPRAFQLEITRKGESVIGEAVTIVHALQDDLTAPIGGSAGVRNRQLATTLRTLLDPSEADRETPYEADYETSYDRSEAMTITPTLTGQDIAEAQGAVRGLLDQVLRTTGITSSEYVTLRVVSARGPWPDRASLAAYLVSQPQLGMDADAVDAMLASMNHRGLITNEAPVLTTKGTDVYIKLGQDVAEATTRLYAEFDTDDLAVAHRVLAAVTERAQELRKAL